MNLHHPQCLLSPFSILMYAVVCPFCSLFMVMLLGPCLAPALLNLKSTQVQRPVCLPCPTHAPVPLHGSPMPVNKVCASYLVNEGPLLPSGSLVIAHFTTDTCLVVVLCCFLSILPMPLPLCPHPRHSWGGCVCPAFPDSLGLVEILPILSAHPQLEPVISFNFINCLLEPLFNCSKIYDIKLTF